MASAKRHHRSRESQFIYDLPYSITRQICCNLDVDRAWEKLASEIGYTIQEVRIFEMAIQHQNGSPCKDVLSDWGSKNATARDLYHILQRIGRRREVQLLESYFNCYSEKKKTPFQSHDDSPCTGTVSPSMIIRTLDTDDLPGPPSKSSSKMSSGAWSTSSMNGSTSMSDKNDVNLNTPENPKDKATKKHAEYKAIPTLTDEQFYPQKKHDYLGIMKETSGLSSSSSSCGDEKSMSYIKMNKCEMDGPAMGKGDMGERALESSWMETLKNKDGYSSLAKDGKCDIDVAVALVGTQSFTNKELNHATNGFSEEYKIGEGAFGEVFRGFLKRTHCAIKRLFPKQDDYLNHQEHLTSELKSLIKYRHENIVPLYGYTLEGGETCLVYQFMQNGSLDDRLKCKNNTKPLSWHQRLEIMKGAACGLQYLHTLDQKPLIHGDIKCSNILLDKHMEAKIGDLGLAKHATGGSQSGKLTHITKKQTGTKQYQTKAYLPPEVIRGNAMSIKGDTYSFGVIMLEVFTGEAAYDENREGGQFLKDYVKDFSDMDNQYTELIDKGAGFIGEDVAKHFFKVASRCTSQLKKDRPDMVQVHTELGDLETALSQKYATKCLENADIYNGCPPSGSMSDMGETRMDEFSYTSNGYHDPGLLAAPQQPASMVSQQGYPTGVPQQVYMTSMPPQGFMPQQPYPVSLEGQPMTEAMRLQLGYDSGLKPDQIPGYLMTDPTYESDPQKLQEIESEYASDPYKLQQLEETQQPDSTSSHDMPTLSEGDIYQSNVHKLGEIQKFEESLDIPSEAYPAPNSQYEYVSAEPSGDINPEEDEITVSGMRDLTLADSGAQDDSESTILTQPENHDESEISPANAVTDLPGGNQERLAQEVAAVGKKAGFGAMSLFEKYKAAVEMEDGEEQYDTGESVEYEDDYGTITGMDEGHYGQQEDEEEEEEEEEVTLTEEGNEEDIEQITPVAPHPVENRQYQTCSFVHYAPSSPTEATEEDCGNNDSKLFSDSSGALDNDVLTDKYDEGGTQIHLLSDDLVSDSQLFNEGNSSDSQLFCENSSSESRSFTGECKSCSLSEDTSSTDIHGSQHTSTIIASATENDIKPQQVSPTPVWQQQRLEPSEGECFV